MKKLLLAIGAVGLFCSASVVQAQCSLAAWLGGTTGDAAVEDGSAGGNRYEGTCAMRTSNGVVRSTDALAETRFRAGFYFYAESGANGGDLLTLYSDDAGTAAILTVSYDGTNVTVTSNDGGTGPVTVAAAAETWNSFEVDWNSNGAVDVWVNADATSDPASGSLTSGAASTIESASLGYNNGSSGQVVVDRFESRRTQPIGLLGLCDANADATVNVLDLIAFVNDIVSGTPIPGAAQCDGDTAVNVLDLIFALNNFITP